MPSLRVIACVVSVCLVSLGCGSGGSGPTLHKVSGTVSLDGAAIETGSITFIPSGGTSGPTGGSNLDAGGYAVPAAKGLAAGTYRVEIRSQRATGKKVKAQSPAPPGTMIDEMVEAIPETYNTASVLEAEIPAPSNQLDFELKSP